MKVVERKIYNALLGRYKLKQGKSPYMRGYRDEVEITETGYKVKLWGYTIAEKENGVITLSDCQYATQTTASRLNVVCYFEGLPFRYSWSQGGQWVTTKNGKREIISTKGTIKWSRWTVDDHENKIIGA